MNTYAEKLNQLLSSYQLHYQNLRALHWNIKGENFFELHIKYEEWYTRAQIIIDEIAELLLTLEIQPASRFSDYLSQSVLHENPIINDGKTGVSYVLDAQQKLLVLEQEILALSSNKGDESTNSFMSDLICEKEKTNWMLKAWLNK